MAGWRKTLRSARVATNIRKVGVGAAVAASLTLPEIAMAEMKPAPWNSGVMIEQIQAGKSGDDNKPKVGDMVEVRFKGSYKGNEFDNTYKTEMPYLYRAGVGNILPGLDETIVNMHVGEKLAVSFGGDLAFGQKGRPSAPGKPRIPPNAVIDYEVTLESLPGIGDDFIADFE